MTSTDATKPRAPRTGGPPPLTRRTIAHLADNRAGRARLAREEALLLRAEQGIRELDPELARRVGRLRTTIAAALRGEPI